MSIERYIRPENLKAILIPEVELDENGNPITRVDKTIQKKKKEKKRRGRRKTEPDQTYATIGMIGFYEKFDEIMEYFHSKLKGKREDVYEDIMLIEIKSLFKISQYILPYYAHGKSMKVDSHLKKPITDIL